MKKKKVLMLGWEFPPLINGGLGVACHGLRKALAKHVDLTFAYPEIESQNTVKVQHFTNLEPIPTTLHPYQNTNNSDLYSGDLNSRIIAYTRAAVDLASSDDFDLIHAHDWMTFRAGLEIKSRAKKPLVLHLHSLNYDRVGPESRDWIFELERQAMAQADLVIPVSQYTGNICAGHYGIEVEKIYPVLNGAEPVRTFRSPSPGKLVLFLGRLTRQKAPLNFIQIAAKVAARCPKTRFVMAGKGDQSDELIRERTRLNLENQVHLPGFLAREEIHHLFSQTDVYCMPSVSEPFGISALEAAQFGIPTVISKQSGALEALTHSRSADHWDLDLAANHITELLTDEHAHAAASDHSIHDQEKFTWELAAQGVFDLYRSHIFSQR